MKKIIIISFLSIFAFLHARTKSPNVSNLKKLKEITIKIEPASEELIMLLFGNLDILDEEIRKIPEDTISGEITFIIYKLRNNTNPADLIAEIKSKKVSSVNMRVLSIVYTMIRDEVPVYRGVTTVYKSDNRKERFPVIMNYEGDKDPIIFEKAKNMYVKGDIIILIKQKPKPKKNTIAVSPSVTQQFFNYMMNFTVYYKDYLFVI